MRKIFNVFILVLLFTIPACAVEPTSVETTPGVDGLDGGSVEATRDASDETPDGRGAPGACDAPPIGHYTITGTPADDGCGIASSFIVVFDVLSDWSVSVGPAAGGTVNPSRNGGCAIDVWYGSSPGDGAGLLHVQFDNGGRAVLSQTTSEGTCEQSFVLSGTVEQL